MKKKERKKTEVTNLKIEKRNDGKNTCTKNGKQEGKKMKVRILKIKKRNDRNNKRWKMGKKTKERKQKQESRCRR